jgi:hypothetical protein
MQGKGSRVRGTAAGVYVEIDQSNGVEGSLVTCETGK